MKTRFSYVQNASNTQVLSMTGKDIRVMTAQLPLRAIVAAIRRGDTDKKRQLPAVCWGAEFKNGKREGGENGQNMQPTGFCFMDIDHLTDKNRTDVGSYDQVLDYYEKYIEGKEVENGIVHVQVSPSGDGLHIVFLMPEDCTLIEQGQRRLAEQLGLPDYDRVCKDMGRMLYLTTLEDTLYDALDVIG